eukprot:9896393-Alexandrium_andersonii.AAC.1
MLPEEPSSGSALPELLRGAAGEAHGRRDHPAGGDPLGPARARAILRAPLGWARAQARGCKVPWRRWCR